MMLCLWPSQKHLCGCCWKQKESLFWPTIGAYHFFGWWNLLSQKPGFQFSKTFLPQCMSDTNELIGGDHEWHQGNDLQAKYTRKKAPIVAVSWLLFAFIKTIHAAVNNILIFLCFFLTLCLTFHHKCSSKWPDFCKKPKAWHGNWNRSRSVF